MASLRTASCGDDGGCPHVGEFSKIRAAFCGMRDAQFGNSQPRLYQLLFADLSIFNHLALGGDVTHLLIFRHHNSHNL